MLSLQVTVKDLPFGGLGESGMGAYHDKFSYETFSHKKGVLYQSFSGDADLRYPSCTPKDLRLLLLLAISLVSKSVGQTLRSTNSFKAKETIPKWIEKLS